MRRRYWRKRYAGLMASEMKRLRHGEGENGKLKKIVADHSLDKPAAGRDRPKLFEVCPAVKCSTMHVRPGGQAFQELAVDGRSGNRPSSHSLTTQSLFIAQLRFALIHRTHQRCLRTTTGMPADALFRRRRAVENNQQARLSAVYRGSEIGCPFSELARPALWRLQVCVVVPGSDQRSASRQPLLGHEHLHARQSIECPSQASSYSSMKLVSALVSFAHLIRRRLRLAGAPL